MPKYRALWAADIHLANTLPHSTKDPSTGVTDRLLDIKNALDEMRNYAIEEEIGTILILGDFFDKSLLDPPTLKVGAAWLDECRESGITIFMIPGNHDAHDAACRHYGVEALCDTFGVDGVHKLVVNHDLVFWALGYQPEQDAIAMIREVGASIQASKSRATNVLLIHQTIKGAVSNTGTHDSPTGVSFEDMEGFDFAFAGHYHLRQKLKHGKFVAEYLGSLVQLDYGDCGQVRGFHDLTISYGKKVTPSYESKHIETRAPRFHVFVWNGTKFQFQATPGLTTEMKVRPGDYVRFQVSGNAKEIEKANAAYLKFKTKAEKVGVRSVKFSPTLIHEAKIRCKPADIQVGSVNWSGVVGSYIDGKNVPLKKDRLLRMAEEVMS